MKKSKVFLFVDHEAGWGIAAAEAMACRLPVVGYDNGVLGDVFKQGFLKVRLKDIDSFAASTIKVLESKKLQSRVSREAIQESKKHDWENTSEKFAKILDEYNTRL